MPNRLPSTMPTAEYILLRKKLGKSNYALAPLLGIALATAQRYESGKAPIAEPVAKLLRLLAWRDGTLNGTPPPT